MRGAWVVIVTSTACGRIAFDPGSNAPLGDGTADAATERDCSPAWRSGAPRLSAARSLDQLNTAAAETDPFISRDGLTLYFVRDTGPQADIMIAIRPDLASPFANPTVLALNTTSIENKLSLAGDELIAAFVSTKPGGLGLADIWLATRTNRTNPFADASQALLGQVNTSDNELDPHLSNDGLRLYFSPRMGGTQTIAVTSRSSTTAPFGPPTTVAGLLPASQIADPALSADETLILYSSFGVYSATRTTTADSFSGSALVPGINGSGFTGDPALTNDSCALYFSSDRLGNRDLFVADVMP
jgi:Tol biopolymer transport system component